MTDADLLRRAATRLRDPYRCNSDRAVDLALAAAFERAAESMAEIQFLANTHRVTEPHLAHLADLIEVRRVARAVLGEPAPGGVVEQPEETK